MVSIEEFRESFINEEINASAVVDSRYPIEVFIDVASDIEYYVAAEPPVRCGESHHSGQTEPPCY